MIINSIEFNGTLNGVNIKELKEQASETGIGKLIG